MNGFSLVELMVTITISAIALAAAAPLGAAWVNGTRVVETRSVLIAGFGQTKSYAVRNRRAVNDDAVSAVLCIDQGVVKVFDDVPGDCSGAAVWSLPIPGADTGTQVEANAATFNCIALTRLGQPVAANIGGSACATVRDFTVTRHGEQVNGSFI